MHTTPQRFTICAGGNQPRANAGTRSPSQRRLLPWAGTVFLLLCCLGLQLQGIEVNRPVETDFVTLRSMSFAEAEGLLTPFLSEAGKLGYAATRQLLVIHDYAENIQTIKRILQQADTDPVNIRIEVRFDETVQNRYGGVNVDIDGLRIEHRQGRTRTGGTATATAGAGQAESTSLTTQFVMTASGREAQIWAGETVRDPVWTRHYGRHHGWWEVDFVEQDLGASLWVLPRMLPDGSVEVDVYPRVSARGNQADYSIAVQELSTRVVAANGQTVTIGGLDQERQEAYNRLFGIGRLFNGSSLNITLTPRIVHPRQPGSPARDGNRSPLTPPPGAER